MPRAAPVTSATTPAHARTPARQIDRGDQIGAEPVEQRAALGGGGPGRIAEHPVRAHRAHAAGPQQRQSLGQRPGVAGVAACSAHPRRASASSIDVSARPACGSPSQRGRTAARRGTRRAASRPRGPAARRFRRAPRRPAAGARRSRAADRPSSTSSSSSAACPIDSVPGKPACSPLEPYGQRGRDEHVVAGRREALAQRDRDVGVGGQRQVRAVLLGRPERHREHRAAPRPARRPRARSVGEPTLAISVRRGVQPGQRVLVAGGDRAAGGRS